MMLTRLDRLINERFDGVVVGHGVTRRQWQLFNLLVDGAKTADELTEGVAPFLDIASGETARWHLDPLAEQGLVRFDGDAYSLTDAGRERFEALAREVRAVRERTTAGLGDGEYEAVVAGLGKMIRNLEGER